MFGKRKIDVLTKQTEETTQDNHRLIETMKKIEEERAQKVEIIINSLKQESSNIQKLSEFIIMIAHESKRLTNSFELTLQAFATDGEKMAVSIDAVKCLKSGLCTESQKIIIDFKAAESASQAPFALLDKLPSER